MNKQELAEQIYQKYFPTSNGKPFGMYEKKSVLAAIIEAMDSLPTMKWVNASKRLPERINDKIFRQISSKILLSISMAKDWIEDGSIGDLEWLDESAPAMEEAMPEGSQDSSLPLLQAVLKGIKDADDDYFDGGKKEKRKVIDRYESAIQLITELEEEAGYQKNIDNLNMPLPQNPPKVKNADGTDHIQWG